MELGECNNNIQLECYDGNDNKILTRVYGNHLPLSENWIRPATFLRIAINQNKKNKESLIPLNTVRIKVKFFFNALSYCDEIDIKNFHIEKRS